MKGEIKRVQQRKRERKKRERENGKDRGRRKRERKRERQKEKKKEEKERKKERKKERERLSILLLYAPVFLERSTAHSVNVLLLTIVIAPPCHARIRTLPTQAILRLIIHHKIHLSSHQKHLRSRFRRYDNAYVWMLTFLYLI